MSYIGKNPEADSVKLKGSATEPSGTAVDGQVYFNTGAGSISKGMKVYKNSQFVAIDKQLGDADTMQLLKAADIPAIDFNLSYTSTTVGGHGAVPFESSTGDFDGTAAFSNSSTGDALLTDDSNDLVFHYTTQATNNAKNDFWGIPLTVPRAFRGGNLVLEMKYRTEIATGTMDDGYFNIAVLDRSASLQLTLSSTIGTTAIAAGATVALAGKTYANPVTSTTLTIAVGDRVFVESGAGTTGAANTGSIVDCYVTSVSSTANEITLSKAITPCNLGRITSGWLTGVEAINAFASDTNKDGTSKKLAFKTDADTQQVSLWFFVKGTSTVKHELFFDNVLLSANKFLQASSQTKIESWGITFSTAFWDGTGIETEWDFSLLSPGPGSPPYDQSKLVDFPTLTGPGTHGAVTAIRAKQDVKVTAQIGAYQGDGNYLVWFDQDGLYLAQDQQASNSGQHFQSLPISMVIPKGDYIFAYRSGVGNQNGEIQITAEPMQSPVILLESQDEIFTSWVDWTPTQAGFSTFTAKKFMWRRVGDSMEIMANFNGATGSTDAITFTIPPGYNMDFTKMRGDNETNVLGFAGKNSNLDGTYGFAVKSSEPQKIYVTLSTGADNIFNAVSGASVGNSIVSGSIKVPIQGWNSNFNPLLSMPLVEIGANAEQYLNNGWTGRAGVSTKSLYSTNTPAINTINNLGTITNSSGSTASDGFGFTASQRVKVTMSFGNMSDAYEYLGIVKNASAVDPTGTDADGKKIITGEHLANQVSSLTGVVVLEPNESLWVCVANNGTLVTGNYAGSVSLVVEKDFSNTNMAHIIKPAIAIGKGVFTNGSNEGSSGSGTYAQRKLNVWEGDTWFVSGFDGTLGPSGTTDQFDLDPGTYKVHGYTTAYKSNGSFSLLQDLTSAVLLYGGNGRPGSGDDVNVLLPFAGTFTITEKKTFKLWTWTTTAQGTYGLGVEIGTSTGAPAGRPEQYSEITIEKLK